MRRTKEGNHVVEAKDISQGILTLAIRQAKTNSLIKALVEINKQNNREMKKIRKLLKKMGKYRPGSGTSGKNE